MYAIVERFAQLLATPPDPPAFVVSLSIDDQPTTGLGRVTRPNEVVTRTTASARPRAPTY